MRIDRLLEQTAARLPEKTALICGGKRWSYEEVERAARGSASVFIEHGVRPGDRVAIFLDNSFESIVSIYGAARAGAVFVVLNPTMRAPKLAHILSDSGARLLVSQTGKARILADALENPAACEHVLLCGPGRAAASLRADALTKLRRSIDVTPWAAGGSFADGRPASAPGAAGEDDDPADRERGCHPAIPVLDSDDDLVALIYTSGSTGEPKGVMSTHANISAAIESITTYLENNENDIVLDILPLSFDYGLYQVLMTFAFGGTLVLERSFAYPFRIVERLLEERVTGFPIVPAMAAILLRMDTLRGRSFPALRYITNTAAALPPEHIAGLRELFPGARIYSMYGLTECKRVSYLPPDRLRDKPTSVGIPMPGTRVAVVDQAGCEVAPGTVGELLVRGPNVMQGYWNAPEETARVFRTGGDGERVLHTGDLFYRDDEGFLYFVGRRDGQIKSMGERISPREIETVLLACPLVAEAAVFGVPDPVAGQVVKAAIVPAPGARIAEREIIRHCRDRLEPFMIPRYVEFVPSLPLTPHGKIDTARLARDHCPPEEDTEREES